MRHICNICILFLSINFIYAQKQEKIYKNATMPIEERVADLLARMTLDEKCRQIDIWHPKGRYISNKDTLRKCIAENDGLIKEGVGFLQFDTYLSHEQYAKNFNSIQSYLMDETRLGIPAISNGEGCHGFVGSEGTVFPVPLTLGSTWDLELIEQVYIAIGKEMRGYGITHAASPVIDVLREPRYGRCDEMYGEDPYLVGEFGVAAICGLQGREQIIGASHLMACAKHFGAHSQPEGGTNLSPANLSERVLRENHFYPFERAVRDANVRTVMASYNEIDGVPSHCNSWLLNDILRKEWGFTGYVISDYDAVRRMIYRQHVCHNMADAAKRSITSGMDFECPGGRDTYCFSVLPDLIRSREIPESVLDSAVARILRNKFQLGLFENPYVSLLNVEERRIMQKKHIGLAQKAAEEGMVLLKNDNNVLPFFSKEIKHLAVIGPNANEVHYGTYSNDSIRGISILDGLREYGKGLFEVHYAEGYKIYENDILLPEQDKTLEAEEKRIQEAVSLASQCDAVLLVMGGNELTCREGWGEDRTGDRVDLKPLGRQDDLVKAVLSVGKKTAALLINGRPLAVNYMAEYIPAIIEGWYLGQAQGVAVANILFGNVNPSGKLTVTIPRSVGQLPVYYNHKPIVHERSFVEGSYSPLFPFGHGLSYTTFDYSNLAFDKEQVIIGESVKVSIDIKNTGNRDGEEVVQLYIRDKVSSVTRPLKELKDFKKVFLKKGETKTVTFLITADKLQFYDIEMNRVVESGDFEVMVGGSSVSTLNKVFEVL